MTAMRIAVDAMGSDAAPNPEIEGALMASAAHKDMEIILVGDQKKLESDLAGRSVRSDVSVRHASEVVSMDDSPVVAVRQKKDSSLLVAMRMVKNGEADGIVSAGNTGAVMMAARIVLGPIKGVARSPICQQLPSLGERNVLVIDMGANVDCSARHLCEFGEMGMVYAERALGYKHPRVGLLNIGEEQAKGNELSKKVHRYLAAAEHINFIGNVEPIAIFKGEVDVVVCDGFIGNLVLKTSEAAAFYVGQKLKRELNGTWMNRIGALLSMKAFKNVKKCTDPNLMPGAPLLGVNGTVIITHGSSKAEGIASAIAGAKRAIDTQIVENIRREITALRSTELNLQRIGETVMSTVRTTQSSASGEASPARAVVLFPGQGSQTPGMGEDLYRECPEERPYFDKASEVVPGILDSMFRGPAEALSRTQVAQVALLTVEAALLHYLKRRGLDPDVVAGHSLGEFSALACSGSMTFEEALRLVRQRGVCMSENVPEGGMAAVVGIPAGAIEDVLPKSVVVANYNGPQQTIISGTLAGLKEAEQGLKEAGAKRVIPLPVSGPFHSPLMEPAAKAFRKALQNAEIRDPQCRFVSSVTGGELKTAQEIREVLSDQIVSPVRWTDVMKTLGPVTALEVGPGKVLQGLAKRMDNAPKIQGVGNIESANAVEVSG
jgi:glycerol-3-phosphate acyltransferase PlsX